jgi:hypothetical protein
LFVRWIKRQIETEENASKKNFSYAEVVSMLSEWTSRFDEELLDLQESEKKKTREHEVGLMIEEEKQRLRTGYETPDLRMNKVQKRIFLFFLLLITYIQLIFYFYKRLCVI